MTIYDFSKIPENLKSIPHWLTWRYDTKENGNLMKTPNVEAGEWDTKKLWTYQGAVDEYERCQRPDNKSRADGIGIAIRTDNELVGIDIDHVTADTIPERIRAILTAAKESGGYIEKSVSKQGFHILGTCTSKSLLLDLFKNWRNISGSKSDDQHLEMYAASHYFTVSGYTLYSNFGNIDKAIELAWEYITGKPLFTCVSAIYAHRTTINGHTATTENKTTNHTSPSIKTQYRANPNANFSADDLHILQMPVKPMGEVIKTMYGKNPVIKNVLEQGYDAFPKDWYDQLSDQTPSGMDMRIAGTVTFWLYRYGADAVADFLRQSVLNRDKAENYWSRTVTTAFQSADKFYAYAVDTKKLPPLEKKFFYEYIKKKQKS